MGSGRGSGLSCRALDIGTKVFEFEADRAILLCLKILLKMEDDSRFVALKTRHLLCC